MRGVGEAFSKRDIGAFFSYAYFFGRSLALAWLGFQRRVAHFCNRQVLLLPRSKTTAAIAGAASPEIENNCSNRRWECREVLSEIAWLTNMLDYLATFEPAF
jgi:hypothetical protein